MNKRQENKLTMYEGVLSLLRENEAKIQSIAKFKDAVAEFDTVIGMLKSKSIEVKKATAGKTASKHSAEDGLVECLLTVCPALYLYGADQNNPEIKERVDITESSLRKMRDTELGLYGTEIADMAEAHSKNAEPFGLTPEKITEIKAKAKAYSDSIGSRESSVSGRIGSHSSMNSLFGRADVLLNEDMDRYMEQFRPLDTEFYDKYFAARVIKDIGVRHKPEDAEPAPAAAQASE